MTDDQKAWADANAFRADREANRQRIIDRIRKLSAMTTTNGASEAEASKAAEMIAKLTAEWQPTEQELRRESRREAGLRKEGWTEFVTSPSDRTVSGITPDIATLFDCRVWTHRDVEDLGFGPVHTVTTFYFGFDSDVVAAIAMTQIISTAVTGGFEAWAKTQGRALRAKATKRDALDSFRHGMFSRLAGRLRELKGQKATAGALTIVKDDLIHQGFAALGLNLSGSNALRVGSNGAGFAAGFAAGSTVNLGSGRALGGTRAIGRQA